MSLAKEFEKKQKNLFIIPFYRDHFLHQSNVYLLGITIISILERKFKNNIVEDFNRSYYPVDGQKYQYRHDACAIWFLASMFHDISYPVEKSGQWLDAFSHKLFPLYVHKLKQVREYRIDLIPVFDINIITARYSVIQACKLSVQENHAF